MCRYIKIVVIFLYIPFFVCCSSSKKLEGVYINKCYALGFSRSIIELSSNNNYSMVYLGVIGEKEIGKWIVKNDSLILNMEYEIINNLKDTVKVKNKTFIYIIKRKNIHDPINVNCYFQKKGARN
ncbi:hypothetical protein [Flavobacterium sp.]|uniref:hypothetical protein n=1 Tax=Flavobacterium sp. TaxID=239 RepID=UPI002625A08D|nr:hypothetical protein [Flavobacterium sp.]